MIHSQPDNAQMSDFCTFFMHKPH